MDYIKVRASEVRDNDIIAITRKNNGKRQTTAALVQHAERLPNGRVRIQAGGYPVQEVRSRCRVRLIDRPVNSETIFVPPLDLEVELAGLSRDEVLRRAALRGMHVTTKTTKKAGIEFLLRHDSVVVGFAAR